MILNDKEIETYVSNMKQEHENRRKQLILFAMSCSDYLSLAEAYSLPYKDREIIYKIVEEQRKKLSKS